jgi:hypothetical protein
MAKELDINLLIEHHKHAINTREMCINTLKETECKTDKDGATVANFAIASRACLDLSEALEAILENAGVFYSEGKYFTEVKTSEKPEDEAPKDKD